MTDHTTILDLRADRPLLRGRLHLVGVVVVVVAAPFLLAVATDGGRQLAIGSHLVGVLVMLGVSAAYHVIDWPPRGVLAMRRADHSAIFVGIAGCYIPFLVTATTGVTRVVMLVVVGVGAALGIAISNVFHHAPPWVHTIPYLALGWIGVLLVPALWRLSPTVMWLVAAGGLAYTLGAVVYARQRPDPWPFVLGYHEVFHALTLVAVALHLVAAGIAVAT